MTLVLATENRHKWQEIQSILGGGADLVVRTLADYPGVTLPPEMGATYRENAAAKATFVARATGEWAMGDDSGLEVDALNGAPGLYSARFAGVGASYADNQKKLLESLDDLPDEKRTARFICTVALAGPAGSIDIVEGVCPGRIARAESGDGGFGYDPIFFLPEYGKTFAELAPSEKNKVSHRGQAVRAALAIWMSVSGHPLFNSPTLKPEDACFLTRQ